MGWRGTLRAMEAASRRAAREDERREKAYRKVVETAEAKDAVTAWREHLDSLVSAHVKHVAELDWQQMLDRPEPKPPTQKTEHADAAMAKLDSFSPKFRYVFSGGSNKQRAKLADAVIEAKSKDDLAYQKSFRAYEKAYSDWQSDRDMATRLLSGEKEAELEVIKEMATFNDEGLLGSHIEFRLNEELLHVILSVHGIEIVPDFRRKQLASGRLSESKMPVGERHELYQDYVCSAALKVASELMALVPRDEVYVTCMTSMLDKSTGHMADTPILSVQFVRTTIQGLRLSAIDPSDSMTNFNHKMSFKRTTGFSPIEPLKPIKAEELQEA